MSRGLWREARLVDPFGQCPFASTMRESESPRTTVAGWCPDAWLSTFILQGGTGLVGGPSRTGPGPRFSDTRRIPCPTSISRNSPRLNWTS